MWWKTLIQIILRLLAGGAVGFAVSNEVDATGGNLGLQQIVNIIGWLVGAAAVWVGTSGDVLAKIKALFQYGKDKPFPMLQTLDTAQAGVNATIDCCGECDHVTDAECEKVVTPYQTLLNKLRLHARHHTEPKQ